MEAVAATLAIPAFQWCWLHTFVVYNPAVGNNPWIPSILRESWQYANWAKD